MESLCAWADRLCATQTVLVFPVGQDVVTIPADGNARGLALLLADLVTGRRMKVAPGTESPSLFSSSG